MPHNFNKKHIFKVPIMFPQSLPCVYSSSTGTFMMSWNSPCYIHANMMSNTLMQPNIVCRTSGFICLSCPGSKSSQAFYIVSSRFN